jgi:uncharacterized protein
MSVYQKKPHNKKNTLTGRIFFIVILFLLSSSTFFLPTPAHAYVSPGAPTGLVNDFAHVLSAPDSIAMGQKLLDLNKTTGVQMVVVLVPSLGDETIDTYAVKLFKEWGIGNTKTTRVGSIQDNGLLILISTGDHKVRIEVGYGLEGTVTDLVSGKIVKNTLIPAFKHTDYAGGISAAVDMLSSIIAGDPSVVDTTAPSLYTDQQTGGNYFSIIFFILIALNILSGILGKSTSWWLGGVLGTLVGLIIGLVWGFIYIGFGAILILTILGLIFDYVVSKHPARGGGGMWPIFFGGGNGGGFGSGGFGGFGGGRSGGGGASGGW